MQIWRAILFSVLGVVGFSCRSTDSDAQYRAWLLDNFKREAATHSQVVLVCIYESHFQRLPLPSHHHLDCKGTVVRSYKGDWKLGEQISLHHELESAPEGWTPGVGYLEFFLLNKHTSGPIDVDVGENWDYTPEFDRALQVVYSGEARRQASAGGH